MGATNKSKYGNCLSKDHIDIMILPKSTKAAVNQVQADYDLDEFDSWIDVYDRGEHLESDYKKNVSTYMAGYIQRKLEDKHPCVYCQNFFKEGSEKSCDLIDIKNRGGLVTPSLAIDSVVNITERILSQTIKGQYYRKSVFCFINKKQKVTMRFFAIHFF